MISSNAISSHATDTDALAACVSASSCYGIVYAPANSESTRWSARLGGAGVGLFSMNGVTSYVYSGSCRRRMLEGWADADLRFSEESNAVPPPLLERVQPHDVKPPPPPPPPPAASPHLLARMFRSLLNLPDMEDRVALSKTRPATRPGTRPEVGPLHSTRATFKKTETRLERNNRDRRV